MVSIARAGAGRADRWAGQGVQACLISSASNSFSNVLRLIVESNAIL